MQVYVGENVMRSPPLRSLIYSSGKDETKMKSAKIQKLLSHKKIVSYAKSVLLFDGRTVIQYLLERKMPR